MANLGTLDRASHFGLNGIANTIAQNAVRNGNEWDKLAALLGGYIGNRMGEHKRKKQEAKLDDIVNQAKANPNEPASVVDENGNIYGGNSPLSQDDYSYIMNGQQGEPVISGGVGDNLPTTSQEIANASQAAATQKMPAANGGPAYNPNYNMDYIRQQARKQGISSGVLADREAEIQRDIAQSAEAYYLPQIQKKLYGSKDTPATTDSILEGMGMLGELSKYSPDTAKAYQALAVSGLQGNQKFNQQKELAQINATNRAIADQRRLQNRIDYRNATQNISNNTGRGKNGIDPSKIAAAGKRVQEIAAYVQENGQESLTPALREEYNTLRAYIASANAGGNSVAGKPSGEGTSSGGARDVTGTPEGEKLAGSGQSTSDKVRSIINSIDYGNYDGEKVAEGKKHNFINGTQAAVDTMRKAGANDDQIFKAIDTTLAQKEAAGELPAGYREDFAHSMGRKTDRELTEEALAKQEEDARRLDMQLHPDKYGIDPMSGVKHLANAIAYGKPLFG